jgi:hypothetical protein
VGIAALPSENLDGGRGSLRRRLRRMLEKSETVSWWGIVLMANHEPVRFKVAKRKGDAVLTKIWTERMRTIAHQSKVR